jgi:hypothetical protein
MLYFALLNLAFCQRKVSRSSNAACRKRFARGEVYAQGGPRHALPKFDHEILYSFRAEQVLTLIRRRCNSRYNDSIEGLQSQIAT